MRQLILTLCIVFATFFSVAQEVEQPDTVDILPSDSLHEEFYMVAPAIEFIPADEPPELIADRLSCIQNEFPLTYNKTVHSFIDYFTVRENSPNQFSAEKTFTFRFSKSTWRNIIYRMT
jgi:hypothetical protein